MGKLGMDQKFTGRAVNEGFSGGEKKRNEILQLMMLAPSYAGTRRDRFGPRY